MSYNYPPKVVLVGGDTLEQQQVVANANVQ